LLAPRSCRKPDATAFPAYELFDLDRYYEHNISPAILTKRSCALATPTAPIAPEGPPNEVTWGVVDEIEHLLRLKPKMVMSPNNFNVPRQHAEAICCEIIARKLELHWGTGDLRPTGVTDDFCGLLRESGCSYANLSIESGSDEMLRRMKRGYTAAQVRQALSSLERAKIPFGASLMIGAPGETPETVAESLALLEDYSIPLGTWVTIGICLWTPRQAVLKEAQRAGQFHEDRELFQGANYMSPQLPKDFMIELIETLKTKKGYSVQVNKPYAEYQNN
jgi:hypothetical protein